MINDIKVKFILAAGMVAAVCAACAQQPDKQNDGTDHSTIVNIENPDSMKLATFGSGCFWCTEAVFQRVEGVASVVSGYSGGKIKDPTYREVSSGRTGHAEVIQLTYDPDMISYDELLEIFWKTHDPTTLNRQGADVGTQYRSVVFYHDDEQKKLAEHYKQELDKSGIYDDPIVTEISPFTAFYKAEDYHQNYYNLNRSQPYCSVVITPKLEKFEKVFKDKLKAGSGSSR